MPSENFAELQSITQQFVEALESAKRNQPSSLPYIRHTLPDVSLVCDGEEFQVIVVGGTVFRTARCRYTSGKITVVSKRSEDVPRFKTKEDFISCMHQFVDQDVSVVALNFAYPMKPIFEENILDGVLISGSKENDFEGMIGVQVGKLIADELQKSRGQSLTVSVANDTVCLLLSGLIEYSPQELCGGIVGTGVNFAFFENEKTLINLESANFSRFTMSEAGKRIDEESLFPGRAIAEKEISGAYLYKHYNLEIKKQKLSFPEISRTAELAELAEKQDLSGDIARNIFDRSASLVACQIAAIARFKRHSIVGIMEGSLFWKGPNYQTLVETYVGMLTDYQVQFTKIDDDSILGAAYLVCV